jgi:hypothetical protein
MCLAWGYANHLVSCHAIVVQLAASHYTVMEPLQIGFPDPHSPFHCISLLGCLWPNTWHTPQLKPRGDKNCIWASLPKTFSTLLGNRCSVPTCCFAFSLPMCQIVIVLGEDVMCPYYCPSWFMPRREIAANVSPGSHSMCVCDSSPVPPLLFNDRCGHAGLPGIGVPTYVQPVGTNLSKHCHMPTLAFQGLLQDSSGPLHICKFHSIQRPCMFAMKRCRGTQESG